MYPRTEQAYNGLNWRVLKRADTIHDGDLDQPRIMYYSANQSSGGWQLLEELINDSWDEQSADDDHTRRMEYIWGPPEVRYIDDIIARQQAEPLDEGVGGPVTATWYHVTDTLFSTVAVLDDDANLIERVSYDAYGNTQYHSRADITGSGTVNVDDLLVVDHNWGNYGRGDLNRDGIVNVDDQLLVLNNWGDTLPAGQLSKTDNIIGYAGYVFNTEVHGSGLYTVRFRHYDPDLGRWIERDPLDYIDGMNVYLYGLGSPIMYVDPLGLWGRWNPCNWFSREPDLNERLIARHELMKQGVIEMGGQSPDEFEHLVDEALESNPEVQEQVDAYRDEMWSATLDGLSVGLDHGGAIASNALTLALNSSLNEHVNDLVGSYGTSYQCADYSSKAGAVLLGSATGVGLWQAGGGATMHVTVGRVAGQSVPHVTYGAGGTTVHGASVAGTVRISAAGIPAMSRSATLSGIPVLNATGVTATGGTAGSCVGAACKGFLRGWYLIP